MKKLLAMLSVFLLCGCGEDTSHVYKEPKKIAYRKAAQAFEAAGMGAVHLLHFAKKIGHDDKDILEQTVQTALDTSTNLEWNGITASGKVEVGEECDLNGFPCKEFTQEIYIGQETYKITARACFVQFDGHGFWVIDDALVNYIQK